MKSFEEILPLITAIIVAIALFYGVTTAIKKSLRDPGQHDAIDSSIFLKEQKRRMNDVRQRQKQLMRDQQQKIRDLQRR